MLSKIIKRFSFGVVTLLARYGEEIVERQLQLDRLTSVVMSIYTCTAVLSKLDTDLALKRKSQEILDLDLEKGKFYCHQSLRMASRFLKAMHQNDDEEIEKLSDRITGL